MRISQTLCAIVCAAMFVAGSQLAPAAAGNSAADAKLLKLAGLAPPEQGDLSAPAKGGSDEKADWDKIEKLGQSRISPLKKGEKPAGPGNSLSQQQRDDYNKRMSDHVAALMKAADEFQKNYPLSSHREEALTIVAGASASLLQRRDMQQIDKSAIEAAEKNIRDLSARKDLPAGPAGVLARYNISQMQQNADPSNKAKLRESLQQQLAVAQQHRKTYPKDAAFAETYLGIAEFAEAVGEADIATDALKQLAASSSGQLKQEAEVRLKTLGMVGTSPDIKFTALDGRQVDLAAMKGKVVLIDFWATWCGPCIQELPNVKKAYDAYHDKGFEIIGISLDEEKDRSKLETFLKRNQIAWPQYFDGKGWENALGKRFGISSIPAMWLVGKDGKIATLNARGNLEAKIQALLKDGKL